MTKREPVQTIFSFGFVSGAVQKNRAIALVRELAVRLGTEAEKAGGGTKEVRRGCKQA